MICGTGQGVPVCSSSDGTIYHVCGIMGYTLKKEAVALPESSLRINQNKQMCSLIY